MTLFKYRQFSYDIIIWAVRWYCKYGISYRELEEMLCERGVNVDHRTIYRWVQRYAPEIEKRLRWYWKPKMGLNWQVDETYIKVKGKWVYLYRAIDKKGHTVDFYWSPRRMLKRRNAFWVRRWKDSSIGSPFNAINTDKAASYGVAITELKKEGHCSEALEHRQIKYLNNAVEADHGKLKRLINPVRGFKSMKAAYATIKGFEVMHMFKKGQFNIWLSG